MSDVLCLHAAGSGPATWDPVRRRLTELGHRVHCPALLGHRAAARRPAYPVEAFRDQVARLLDGLDDVILIGHSFGAYVASVVAARQPDRISRLVLEELPVPPRDPTDGPPARKTLPDGLVRLLLPLLRRRFDPVMFQQVIGELRRPQPDWWDDLATIEAPVLLLTGGDRSHLVQSRYELVARALGGPVTTATIPVGHSIHSRVPDSFGDALVRFLAES